MEDTDFDLLCVGLSPDEAKRMRKILAEWNDGDENGFPVQLAMLTRAQWRAAALVPQAVNESRKFLERHLAEYRQQTAGLVKNLSTVSEDQAKELKNIVAAHTQTVKSDSWFVRSRLAEADEAARIIRRSLQDGVSEWNCAKASMEVGCEKFQKACKELDDRISWRELRRDWLTLLGLISIGIVLGVLIGLAIGFKFH
jgi:hypothetical protein